MKNYNRILLVILAAIFFMAGNTAQAIDRQALVERHKIIITKVDALSPLSVGNGRFTFTADVTGLQTFPDAYQNGIPLTTMAEWGWDYPMMAMTAARLRRGDLTIQSLLLDVQKNTYLPNGHNYQSQDLPCYLPDNGGLLTAVAMMAAGWDGCPDKNAPGFSDDGKWVVRWENLKKMP